MAAKTAGAGSTTGEGGMATIEKRPIILVPPPNYRSKGDGDSWKGRPFEVCELAAERA